jgi:hypothetical protein
MHRETGDGEAKPGQKEVRTREKKNGAAQLMGGNSTDRVSPAIKSVREREYGVGGKRDKNESKRRDRAGFSEKKKAERKREGDGTEPEREREREREMGIKWGS